MTRQREAVLEIVRARQCHYTAEEILTLARERLPSISRATVYNSLHYLEGKGLIRRISGDLGYDRYDGCFAPHGHLVCTECDGMSDLDLPELEGMLRAAMGEDYGAYELKVRYICPECRKTKRS